MLIYGESARNQALNEVNIPQEEGTWGGSPKRRKKGGTTGEGEGQRGRERKGQPKLPCQKITLHKAHGKLISPSIDV